MNLDPKYNCSMDFGLGFDLIHIEFSLNDFKCLLVSIFKNNPRTLIYDYMINE